MHSTDLSKVHESVLDCNQSYWENIEKELFQKLVVACQEQSKIYNEKYKRKGSNMIDVKTNNTKENIFKVFMNIEILQNLFNAPKRYVIGDCRFDLKDEGTNIFDDEDSGQAVNRVYEVNGVFIRLNGVWYSYDGLSVQSWEFVQPKPVQKIEYVKE